MAETLPTYPIMEKSLPFISERESSVWQKLLFEHQKAIDATDSAALRLYNIYTTYNFVAENNISITKFEPGLEKDWYDLRESIDSVKRAIQGVKDQIYGIRITNDDIDILEPNEQTFQGVIIPIIVGVVIVAGAIGLSVWQTKKANKLSESYNDILHKTDKILCSNPKSEQCANWEKTKKEKRYNENQSLADTVKSGISKIGTGLSTGLLIAIPILALLIFGRTK